MLIFNIINIVILNVMSLNFGYTDNITALFLYSQNEWIKSSTELHMNKQSFSKITDIDGLIVLSYTPHELIYININHSFFDIKYMQYIQSMKLKSQTDI